jgi:hypothetical protein
MIALCCQQDLEQNSLCTTQKKVSGNNADEDNKTEVEVQEQSKVFLFFFYPL